jgi:surfeit locus 1 family protein
MTPSVTRRTPIAGAAIATAIALAILSALGVWQLHRLAWKQGLLAQIDTAEHAPPVPLAATTTAPALFTRVTASGTLRGEPHALYGSEVQGNHLGAQLVEILERDHAPPLVVVLGWVATDRGKLHPVSGPATITGYIRLPEQPNWLSAADDLEGRHFYTLAPATLATALGAPDAAPFTLVALGPAPASPSAPIPADALPRPVNNHLQYAFTWFGLGAALLGVFVAWAIKRT